MIELHRLHNDLKADEIEDQLKEMVVAHRVHRYSEENPPSGDISLPCLREGEKIISGQEDTDRFLEELAKFMKVQHTISSDACYIDPETGETC
ncbi:MAG: hypothetical protein R6U28_12870 [Cyclonatronaceae bacterium]